jgi:beta-lactamase superfamily II metal-dependent hydrolase
MLAGLANSMTFEAFSPHIEDMDSSNNCSIVCKIEGLDATGFTYLVTGDTETERWERINKLYGSRLASDALAAAHHGSVTGVHAATLLSISPNTVLISAGVDNQFGHPDPQAVAAYQSVAAHVYSTNAVSSGTCLFTRRLHGGLETRFVRHSQPARTAA